MHRYLKNLFGKKSTTIRKRRPGRVRLGLDALEARTLLAGSLTASLSLVDSVLRVEGTPGEDQIHIRHQDGFIRVDGIQIMLTGDDSPTMVDSVARIRVVRIEVAALEANDVVQMHDVLMAGEAAVPMQIDGGSGNDTLTGGLAGDTIVGGLGDDSLVGMGGADIVYGGVHSLLQPVAWYKGEGDATDATGGNDAFLSDPFAFQPGKIGEAFQFYSDAWDNTGYAFAPNAPELEPSAVSVEAWVQSTAPGGTTYILSKGASGFTAASYALYTGASGGLHFYVFDGSSFVLSPDAGTGIWDGDWHHVVGTFGEFEDDVGTVRLYVDGAEVGEGTSTSIGIGYGLPTSNDLFIGTYNHIPGFTFHGLIDEPTVYNQSLTAAQVQTLYTGGKSALGVVDSDTGRDTLAGGNQSDTLHGGEGDDLLVGENDNDELHGERGNDYLIGAFNGSESESGNAGDTVFAGEGNDSLYGGDGVDWLWGEAGNDEIHGQRDGDALDGGAGNDVLDGDSGADNIVGGEGDDTLDGGTGNDTLWGGYWLNALWAVQDNDVLRGDLGDDQLHGGAGHDLLRGGDDSDLLFGNGGNDRLHGDQSSIFVGGWGGSDTLNGGDGDDALYGGAENDRLIGEEGSDYLSGDDGNDVLIGAFDGSPFEFVGGHDTIEGGAGDDALYGGDGNDQLVGQDGNDFLTGENGNDHLDGGWLGPRAESGGNADVLYGGGGNDFMWGGEGNDTVTGDHGHDTLMGESGRDDLDGGLRGFSPEIGASNDVLDGGEGFDLLWGGEGDDFMVGGRGYDTLHGENGFDILLGGHGNDELHGGTGADYLAGDEHNDKLFGGEGLDIMDGGADHDELWADRGDEQLFNGEKVSIWVPMGDSAKGTNFCGPNGASRLLRSYQHWDATYPEVRSRTQEFQILNPINDIYALQSVLELGTVPDHMVNVMRQWRPGTQQANRTSLNHVLQLLGEGRPVIALVNSSGTLGGNGRINDDGYTTFAGVVPKTLHYVVLTGFDLREGTISYMDYDGVAKTYSFTEFNARWDYRTKGPIGAALTGPLGCKERTIIW